MKLNRKIHVFILTITILGLFLGCSRRAAVRQEPQLTFNPGKPQELPAYRIQLGDQLDIKFFYNPELNETVFVRPDGRISLQLVDDVDAAGLTSSELDSILTQKYAKELRKPVVTVIVRSFAGQRVYVGGEVNSPGLVNITTGMTTLQAILTAGGFRETAKPEGVIVIRKGPDNRPIPIRADLKKTIYGKGESGDIPLRPYDIVYVPKTLIAQANKFVNQYVERLLLFRGTTLGFGFTYEWVKQR